MSLTVWDLPGPRRWSEQVLTHVREGRPVILVCPRQDTPAHLCAHLTAELTVRLRLEVETLPASLAERTSAELAGAAAEKLGLSVDPHTRFGADSLVSHPDLHDMVCVIDALSSDTSTAETWCRFAVEVAGAAQSVPVHDRVRIVVLVAGDAAPVVPPSDPGLGVLWWWGTLSALDVAVYVNEYGLGAVTAAEVVEVGRWDLDLVDELATSRMKALPKPAESMGLDIGQHGGRAPGAPVAMHAGWRDGLVEAWEGRLDHHVTLSGDVDRRIWLAQIRTVFPWLERIRLELADRIGARAASGGFDADVVAELELSRLKGWLYDKHIRLPRVEFHLLSQAVRARHLLAHLEPLPAQAVIELEHAAVAAGIRPRLR